MPYLALALVLLFPYCALAAEATGPQLNRPEDAGPAGMSPGGAPGAGALSPDLATRFPVLQASGNIVLGGGVRGFGMLALYPAPGPRAVLVRRTTSVPAREPYAPVALARVLDPTGRTLAWHEFTDQPTGTTTQVLTLPDGAAGIWRVAFSGGRSGDRLEIGLPATDTWGVRGEMALGFTATTPNPAYLYLPRTVTLVFAEAFGPQPAVALADEHGKPLVQTALDPAKRRHTLVLDPAPAGTVLQVTLPGGAGNGVVFDGVPGLLCPSPEAARALQGGTLEAAGFLVAGPLQARARRWMVAQKPEDLTVNLTWPAEVPPDLPHPRLEALAFGKYAPLSSLHSAARAQVLDPTNPYYGANLLLPKPGEAPRASWESFWHGGVLSPFDAAAVAAAVWLPGRLNPARGNQALVRRATLSAFYHLVSMQGDDLMREGDLRAAPYPLTHAFFLYDGGLAQGYHLLRDQLDPEARAIWRDGLLAVGDKIADYQAYESNQWQHVILGHLHTYLGTGEKRFLGYFEREMTAFVDGAFGPAAKFGQHPAGYYLEEHGPDGNYESLNSFCMVASYYAYRRLPEASPELVGKMRRAIEKSLAFKSFYWLPQPGGDLHCPTAFNCRTDAVLCNPGYPGDYMAHPEFDLGRTRFELTRDPGTGLGGAATFPHLLNNDAWARRLLEWGLKTRDQAFDLPNFGGAWSAELHEAYSLPQMAKRAPLPCEAVSGTWELPGQVAWKRGPLYGVVLYDVAGSVGTLPGMFGGGPTVLWTADTGSVVSSMRNTKRGTVAGPEDLTHACVFGKDTAGQFFWTGKEHPTFRWVESGRVFEIEGAVQPEGTLVWRYELGDTATLLQVTLKTRRPVQEAWVNLPLLARLRDIDAAVVEPGRLRFARGEAAIELTWSAALAAQLTAPLPAAGGPVRCLRIPLRGDGTPLGIRVRGLAP